MLGAAASYQGVEDAPSHPRPDPSCSSPAAHTESVLSTLTPAPSALEGRITCMCETTSTGLWSLHSHCCSRQAVWSGTSKEPHQPVGLLVVINAVADRQHAVVQLLAAAVHHACTHETKQNVRALNHGDAHIAHKGARPCCLKVPSPLNVLALHMTQCWGCRHEQILDSI